MQPSRRYLDALHESAHALVACAVGATVVECDVIPNGKLGGHCLMRVNPSDPIAHAATLMAGALAERRESGESQLKTAATDLERLGETTATAEEAAAGVKLA
jgi:hypothetical protein